MFPTEVPAMKGQGTFLCGDSNLQPLSNFGSHDQSCHPLSRLLNGGHSYQPLL